MLGTKRDERTDKPEANMPPAPPPPNPYTTTIFFQSWGHKQLSDIQSTPFGACP